MKINNFFKLFEQCKYLRLLEGEIASYKLRKTTVLVYVSKRINESNIEMLISTHNFLYF